jgi:hypothetical protein
MLRSILQKSTISTLFCILAGVILYGLRVFDIHHTAFQFVSTGILGSLFFFTLRESGIRHALLVLSLFYVIMACFLTHAYRHGMLARDAVYIGGVGATLFLFSSRVYRRDLRHLWLCPAILGALMGAVMLLATFILAGLFPGEAPLATVVQHSWPVVMTNFVIGLGLGTGFVVCEYLPAAKAESGKEPT